LKTLYLLRHAKSSWKNPALADFDRPLNKRGKTDAPRMAEYALKQGINPQMIISSPALRTRQTAAYFLSRLQPPVALVLEPALYECTPAAFWQVVQQCSNEVNSLLVVGHNTCLEEIVTDFIADLEKLPTCGLATLHFAIDRWEELEPKKGKLLQLVFPKMLPL
jgi:phosphohistidine phosphatase